MEKRGKGRYFPPQLTSFRGIGDRSVHKRRITTEEKAKIVAAVLGTELIKFLALH